MDGNIGSDEDDEEDEEYEDKGRKAEYDGGWACLCNKLAAEHPEHPYTDFEGYDLLDILQNLILGFIEVKDCWKSSGLCARISGSKMDTITGLLGRMFLTLPANLESATFSIPTRASRTQPSARLNSEMHDRLQLRKLMRKDTVCKKAKIGCDDYDITAMTSAECKKHKFNRKDPLGKQELDTIKDGLVMQLG
ncbi:hypothetical protein BJX63DRAFT_433208 [Aspergillus granulosus]|uniref:Uncharacterized protein n=1 Tax=Aspergillus granulosus TaxID=176169 RepID=A0ABR4H8G8_9EURO